MIRYLLTNPTLQRLWFCIATPIVIIAGLIVGTGLCIAFVAAGKLLNLY